MKKILLLLFIAVFAFGGVYTAFADSYSYYFIDEYDAEIPSSYKSYYVSAMKSQGSKDICWAYSTCAVMEAVMKKCGYNNNLGLGYYFDLSENAISAWAVPTCGECGGHCVFDADKSALICAECGGEGYGFLRVDGDNTREGGMELWALGYLASGGIATDDKGRLNVVLTESVRLDFDDTAAIKNAVMTYGSVTMQYNAASQKVTYASDAIGTTGRKYRIYGSALPNMVNSVHSVAIVGWDDNFDRSYFSVNREMIEANVKSVYKTMPHFWKKFREWWGVNSAEELFSLTDEEFQAKFRPASNGAWLVKNSWNAAGDREYNGYAWISYEDVMVNRADSYAISGFCVYGNDCKIYALDECGAVKATAPKNLTGTKYAAVNVFDVSGNEYIKHVTFYTGNGKGKEYKIYMCKYSELDGDLGTKTLLKSGMITHNGYFTSVFSDNTLLTAGKNAIIVEVDGEGETVSFGVDAFSYETDPYTEMTFMVYCPRVKEDESFVISDGVLSGAAEAMGEKCNFTIRLMTSSTAGPLMYSNIQYDATKNTTVPLVFRLSGDGDENQNVVKPSQDPDGNGNVKVEEQNPFSPAILIVMIIGSIGIGFVIGFSVFRFSRKR